MPETRQLAAIMFTDIVGYTALMGESDTKAYQLLKKNRQVQKPIIEKYNGKWLKEMGDGVLASFQTISDAVYCAIEIQQKCKQETDLKLRIGIHQGEVIAEDGDVFGDGVNIASRIEPLAPVGGIYVTESVFRNIENKEGINVSFVREESLKNVKHPVKIYEIDVQASEMVIPDVPIVETVSEVKTRATGWVKPVFIIPLILLVVVVAYLVYTNLVKSNDTTEQSEQEIRDKSIAVLPFVNMSDDPDQEYFSDGMMEEILNHLFQIGDLLVTSRTSVMKYKGTVKSIPEIAQELGVSVILEGSVRKSGNQVRIMVQLIDGQTDKHLWSNSFDRTLDDIFSIQSEVAQNIASTLHAEIHPEVRLRIESQPTDNMEAYNLFLEARKLDLYSEDENKKALTLLHRVIKLDPNYSMAYVHIGLRFQSGATFSARGGGMDPREADLMSRPYLKKAIELDPDNGFAHQWMACSLLWFNWDFEGAEREYKEVKRIYPNSTWTDFLIATGKFEEALEGAQHAMDFDPNAFGAWIDLVDASYFVGEYQNTIDLIKTAMADSVNNTGLNTLSGIGRIYTYLEKYKDALEVVEIIRKTYPENISPRVSMIEAISEYHLGNMENVNQIIEKLKVHSMDNAGGSPSFYTAMIYAQMGEVDTAFDWLEKAYETHEVEMYWLKVEPPFKPLHDDPRWQVMLDKVGFPD